MRRSSTSRRCRTAARLCHRIAAAVGGAPSCHIGPASRRWGAPSRRFVIERFGANLIDRFGPCKVLEDVMLKTRITEQYGLMVPFINAGMAFIATAPLVRARRSPRTSRAFASLTFVELEH
jgi:hypothetical protein